MNEKLICVMNNLAKICDSKVCTESVETEKQCEIVSKCGVDSIQGYYFSRPVPLQTFGMMVEQKSAKRQGNL